MTVAEVTHEVGRKAVAVEAIDVVGHGQAHRAMGRHALVVDGKLALEIGFEGLDDKEPTVAGVAGDGDRALGLGAELAEEVEQPLCLVGQAATRLAPGGGNA